MLNLATIVLRPYFYINHFPFHKYICYIISLSHSVSIYLHPVTRLRRGLLYYTISLPLYIPGLINIFMEQQRGWETATECLDVTIINKFIQCQLWFYLIKFEWIPMFFKCKWGNIENSESYSILSLGRVKKAEARRQTV